MSEPLTRRDLLAQIRKLSIDEQRELVRKAARGPLTDAEVRIFVENAQVALAGPGVHESRIGFLVQYAAHLEDALLLGSISRPELAWVLVSIAQDLLYGD